MLSCGDGITKKSSCTIVLKNRNGRSVLGLVVSWGSAIALFVIWTVT